MLLIVIVALIATTAFYRQAKLVGVHPGKAASIPFIAAGIILALTYVGSVVLTKFMLAADGSKFTVGAIRFMFHAFVFVAYLMLIRRNWLALTATTEA